MKGFLEIGPDGHVIEWRAHPLTEAARDLPGLNMEPVLHPAGSFTDIQLTPEVSQHSICWTWGGRWAQVELRPLGAPGAPALLTRHRPEPPIVGWDQLSFCDAVELTPFDAQGKAGITARVERPLALGSGDVECEWRGAARLRVRILGRVPPHNLGVRLIWNGRAPERFVPFGPGGSVEVSVHEFRGDIAVVHRRGAAERLIYCASWAGTKEMGMRAREVSEKRMVEVRQLVEGGNGTAGHSVPTELQGWLNQWPQESGARLQKIYEAAALRLGGKMAASNLRQSLAGLFRTVLLCSCGLEPGATLAQLVGHLNDGGWEEALRRLSPQLPEALDAAPNPAEKLWVVANAQAAGLKEAVDWAGGRGVAALGRALGLVELRRKAAELEALLRPDSEEGRDISRLVGEIEDAPNNVKPVEPLHMKFEEVEREVRRQDARRPDPDGPPPPGMEAYIKWLTKCRLRQHWRAQLARVLTYSERGEWPAAAPADPAQGQPEFNVDELMWRLGRVEAPKVRSFGDAAPAFTDEVQAVVQCINQLIQEVENETSEPLRALARKQLNYVIAPHAASWAPLYGALRRVEGQAQQFRWFASCAGVNGQPQALNARLDAAQKFLDMIEALESRLSGWGGGLLTRAAGGLRVVLSTPGHPAVAEAYARAMELKLRLAPTEYADDVDLPPVAPSPPAAASVEQLGQWWDALRGLEASLARLESYRERVEEEEDSFREQLGRKVADLLAYWGRREAGERPDYYAEMKRLYALCASRPGAGVAHVRALTDLLDAHPHWRDDWEEFARR